MAKKKRSTKSTPVGQRKKAKARAPAKPTTKGPAAKAKARPASGRKTPPGESSKPAPKREPGAKPKPGARVAAVSNRRGSTRPPHIAELREAIMIVAEFTAYVLNKDCAEAIVLKPLANFPRAAEHAAAFLAVAPSSYIRCLAPLLLSYTSGPTPSLLRDVWDTEVHNRDNPSQQLLDDIRAMDEDPAAFGPPTARRGARKLEPLAVRARWHAQLEANSVAQRVVMCCVRWLPRGGGHAVVAAEVLVDMIERTINGEAWDDAHIAVAALLGVGEARSSQLLDRLAAAPPATPNLPRWTALLRARDPGAMAEPSQLAADPDVGSAADLPSEEADNLAVLLAAAAEFERVESSTQQ